MLVGGRYFDSRFIKGNKGQKRLHEVLVTADDFSITQHYAFDKMFYIYIWDKKGNLIKGRQLISKRLSQDKNTYNEYLKPRMENCEEIKQKIESNLNGDAYNAKGWGLNYSNNMFYNIINEKCD